MESINVKEMADEMSKDLAPIADTPVAPAHGIAAIALNMALKYHDTNMVKDGALYQQYKLEGKNFRPFTVDEVFETAMRMEAWLLGASDRIAKIVIDCVEDAVIEAEDDPAEEGNDPTAVHLSHCNQDEYVGSCKYGDDDCPALSPALGSPIENKGDGA